MFRQFQYEAEFYPSLTRIPLDVRLKLDITGIKISLKDWLAFAFAERVVLCHLPCESDEEKQAFTAYLDFLSLKYSGAPIGRTGELSSVLWHESVVPPAVRAKSGGTGQVVTPHEWLGWNFHERYALYKTATSQSQPEAFSGVLEQLRAEKNLTAGS